MIRLLKRLLISPRKCFILLVISTIFLFLMAMWNQTTDTVPRVRTIERHPRNVSYSLLFPENFSFLQSPVTVCPGEGEEEGVRARWGELLQARPDNEEPAAPEPRRSRGVVVVTGACGGDVRERVRRTWGSGAWMEGERVRVVFVCRQDPGTPDASIETESSLFADTLHYTSTHHSTDLLAALFWIRHTCTDHFPDFIIHTYSSAFLNLPTLLSTADRLSPGMYGGIQATTPAFLDSLIAHPKDNLLLAHHTEYLNPGIVLIKTEMRAFLGLLTKIPFVPDEGFFVTGIVADYAELDRRPLDKVVPTWNGRSGCWINHQNAFLHVSAFEKDVLWSAMTNVGEFSCRQGDGCCEDGYSVTCWSLGIWLTVLLISYSLVHTFFWSQLSLFCADICSTVDLDGDEYDDSPDLSAVNYDSDQEQVLGGDFYGVTGNRGVDHRVLIDSALNDRF